MSLITFTRNLCSLALCGIGRSDCKAYGMYRQVGHCFYGGTSLLIMVKVLAVEYSTTSKFMICWKQTIMTGLMKSGKIER